MKMREILEEYLENILPRMMNKGYHLRLAKGGIDFSHLSEQTMLSHILTGMFGLSRLWAYLDGRGILPLDETEFRRVIAFYTLHDMHKIETERMNKSDFSLPLESIENEYQQLGLHEFADVNLHELRAANVSSRSTYHGDIMLGDEGSMRRWRLVRIADAMASVSSPDEIEGIWGHMQHLDPRLARNYRLYYHRLCDIRGVLTNQIHAHIVNQLVKRDFFSLLFFASGNIYLGPKNISAIERSEIITNIVREVTNQLQPTGEEIEPSAYRATSYDFELYTYSTVSPSAFLKFARQKATGANKAKFFADEVKKWFSKEYKKATPFQSLTDFESETGIQIENIDKALGELLHSTCAYLYILDSVLRDMLKLSPEKRSEWLCDALNIPADLSKKIIPRAPLFINAYGGGKVAKYVLPIAHHFLTQPNFNGKTAQIVDPSEVINELERRFSKRFANLDTNQVAQTVLEELRVIDDLKKYLEESLILSFASGVPLVNDPLIEYSKKKAKRHSPICSLCARATPFNVEIRTGILGDSAQEFSNRFLPQKTTAQNRYWCPTCYLEFAMRTLAGLTSPPNVDRGKSRRLFLYLLPNYSFTPEYIQMFGYKTLKAFQKPTTVTVRDYGQDQPSHVHYWIEKQTFDQEQVDLIIDAFIKQAGWINDHLIKDEKAFPGERLYTLRSLNQPNYMLFTWEKTAYGSTKDDAQVPTNSEMWCKAAFGAALIATLTGCKLFVTERPYLPISDPSQVKPTVVLDAPHNILRSVLMTFKDRPVSQEDRHIPRMSFVIDDSGAHGSATLLEVLDLLAASWQINSDLKSKRERTTKDKHIAERLETLAVNPLAGAFFYKQYSRLNEDATPFEIYTKACEILLKRRGGEWMDIVKELAQKSFDLFLPVPQYKRGKAHTYEWVFRDAVDATRKAPAKSLEEIKTFACGRLLRALDRRGQTGRGGGIVNPHLKNLNHLVSDFIGLLIDEVLVKRANSSVATFNRLANSIADGIYFEIDRQVKEKWSAWQQEVAERRASRTKGGK